jgi:hypothetical protein
MKSAHEEDVVLAFRQTVEDDLRLMQSGKVPVQEDILAGDPSPQESIKRLAIRHQQLEHEVALLRTIVLRLLSEPLDDDAPEVQ